MRYTATIALLLLAGFLARSQDLTRVDAAMQLYPETFQDASQLSERIGRDFKGAEERLRAVYTWIIHRVAYDPEEYKKFDYTFKNYRERNRKEEKTRNQIIRRTIQTGKAVCEGYAMLFERLCTDLGISNYLVRGDIKTHFDDIGRPYRNIHMWNVAVIDGQPYLFDPTWGAGKFRDKFIREPSYFYYKTPPELFVRSHYPSISSDTLLEEPMDRETFASWPLLIHPELTIDKVIAPRVGVLSSREPSGRFSFRLRIPDSTVVSYALDGAIKNLRIEPADDWVEFEIPFKLGQKELLIYFDDQPALAYKIK